MRNGTIWQDATAKSPQKWRPWANLACALYETGLRQESIPCLEKVVHMEPRCLAAYQNLGTAYLAVGRIQEAGRPDVRLSQQMQDSQDEVFHRFKFDAVRFLHDDPWLADGDFVYIRNEGDGNEELFNQREDPDERINLARVDAMQPILRRFRGQLPRAMSHALEVRTLHRSPRVASAPILP